MGDPDRREIAAPSAGQFLSAGKFHVDSEFSTAITRQIERISGLSSLRSSEETLRRSDECQAIADSTQLAAKASTTDSSAPKACQHQPALVRKETDGTALSEDPVKGSAAHELHSE